MRYSGGRRLARVVVDEVIRPPDGVRAAAKLLRSELATQRRHRRSVRRAQTYRGRVDLLLHLGSGRKYKAGWVNIDFDPSADLHLDLRRPLPFAAGSVLEIYSEHLLEHLEYPSAVQQLLSEAVRVLVPGGLFSVGVPDAEEILRQYCSGELTTSMPTWAADPELAWVDREVWTTPMHYVNWCFRQDEEHRYAYDEQTLALVLQQAGFTDVRRRPFDAERDSADRRDGTLYVDARTPARVRSAPAEAVSTAPAD